MQRILIDTFFHMMPGHRLSRNIFTGGYRTNYGRYSPFDVYHPNGASMLFSDLQADFDVKLLQQPFSETTLAEADILVVPNPDYPLYEGASPYRIDAPDVEALLNFLDRGGSVILMINSFLSRNDFWEENFDHERVMPLLEKLGVRWDHNFMSDEHNILPAKHGELVVGYGQGGRVLDGQLPAGAEPLLTWEGQVFGFRMRRGKGKIAVVGDAGLVSNGLYHFPGFENAAFLKKLFRDMAPAWSAAPATKFECFEFGHLSCAPSDQGISEKLFRSLRPQARFEIDHHYRHLTFESPARVVGAPDIARRLPISLDSLSGQKQLTGKFAFVAITEGMPTSGFEMPLSVAEKKSSLGSDFTVTGTSVREDLTWKDIGADPAVFGEIGQLVRVNTVVQILAGTAPDGTLRHFTMKQGQIFYDRNRRNVHYGFDILLSSQNLVLAPTV
ncbi:MAG: hypothetical protein JWM88_884 [Verrucomicrobia bacterium]|nr:hypothetical protein [Verrucomicrobiota bacterium]